MLQKWQLTIKPVSAVLSIVLFGCAYQSGAPDMRAPTDPDQAKLRAEVFAEVPKCSTAAQCSELLEKAREWAAQQHMYRTLKRQSKVVVLYREYKFDSAEYRISIKPSKQGISYLNMSFECQEWLMVCENPEPIRLDLYRFVNAK